MKSIFLLVLFLFNLNHVKAQFWKSKSNTNKIDSIELVLKQDRESYNKEIREYYFLTTQLSKKVDSLTGELHCMQSTLDSLVFAEKKIVYLDTQFVKEPSSSKISSIFFCPDSAIIEQVKLLQNCCCLTNESCPNKTSAGGLRIIRKGYQMAVISRTIVLGSCWDFINKVYSNAGYQSANRETIYKSTKGTKYPTPELLHPGDWVYHVNYSYHNVGHSAIFICWKDYDKRMAVTLSYAGQNRSVPGKYGVYDLSGVYNVKRAKE